MLFTRDQEEAKNSLLSFLVDPNCNEFILQGPGGVGKSALVSWFKNEGIAVYNDYCRLLGLVPVYDSLAITATTNKAAEVLSSLVHDSVCTIHSLLGLVVKNNYQTGETVLEKKKPVLILDAIIFIDECSMIDGQLHQAILDYTHNCKIIYVGDNCQLTPVRSSYSIFKDPTIPRATLNQQVRFKGNSGITSLAQQLRNTVLSGSFKPIHTSGSEVVSLSGDEFEHEVLNTFSSLNPSARIVSYTNARSALYNDFIRHEARHLSEPFTVGEHFIANNTVMTRLDPERKKVLLHTEDEVEILDVDKLDVNTDYGVPLQFYRLRVRAPSSELILTAPESYESLSRILKSLARNKAWKSYFYLKEEIADLRPRDACTIHKVQGTTVDTVYVDLSDVGTCRVPDTAARLLYVACTRARKRVCLYGSLPRKYGGPVICPTK